MKATDAQSRAPKDWPAVSVIMANWRGERHIAAAIDSVLAQSIGNLELLVADDASDDRSGNVVHEIMTRDPRVRWLPATANAGPSAARNRALDAARGDWVAIMDSDDLIHPRRLELLIEAADRFGAEMVADDMAFFGVGPGTGGRTLLAPMGLAGPMPVDPATFVEASLGRRDRPDLGYIKPLIRRAALQGQRYDPGLRVGEDYDFCLRLLLRGLRLVLVPLPTYLYRRHAVSLSHRLSVQALKPLLRAHRAVRPDGPLENERLALAMAERGQALERALSYEELVEAIKGLSPGRAARLLAGNPRHIARLGRSLTERLSRRGVQTLLPASGPVRVALLPDGLDLPPEAGTTADYAQVLQLPDLSLDHLEAAPRLVEASCRLTELGSRSPVEVATVGLRGVDLLGLLPEWEAAEAWLAEGEVAQVPRSARLRVRQLAPSA